MIPVLALWLMDGKIFHQVGNDAYRCGENDSTILLITQTRFKNSFVSTHMLLKIKSS